MRDYKRHIIDAVSKRANIDGIFNLDIYCPDCETGILQRGGFSVNEGGGMWSGKAYCGICGWVGVYLYSRDSIDRKRWH